MGSHILPAPFERFLVFDPNSAIRAQARAAVGDLCEWVAAPEALEGLPDSDGRAILVVTSFARLEDALATVGRIQDSMPDSRVTIGVTDAAPPQARTVRVVELDTSPQGLRELLTKGQKNCVRRMSCSDLVGSNPGFLQTVQDLAKAAHAPSNVLVTGESGTGKELAAKMIHSGSERACQPSVCVNCAAIPDALIESEMFGYQKGAFTGADRTEDGAFARAHGGTLVLDEIGDMSPAAQAKLLRVIETKRVARLGSRVEVPADARIIALTNKNLHDMVETGFFRRDLYYRLNVVHIEMPPLRDRLDDLPALVSHFTKQFSILFRTFVEGVANEVLALFQRHLWPGNVRELRNVIEAAFVNQPRTLIRVSDLPRCFIQQIRERESTGGQESELILSVLNECHWNKSHAAKKLHWSRMTLYRKMRRHRLTPPSMKTLAAPAG